MAQQTSDSAIVCSGSTTASVDDIKEIWSYDTKAASKSHKGPESKSKPKRQSKPPAQQPRFPSYGKNSFKGLLPYPSINVDVSQAPVKPLVHNQDVINSQLHDEMVVSDPLYDQAMIKTLSLVTKT